MVFPSVAMQVECSSETLDSRDSFILLDETGATVWQGSASSSREKEFATKIATRLSSGVLITTREGQEGEEFWNRLGGILGATLNCNDRI